MDTKLPIRANVYCPDGICGQSVEVVVDPTARAVTHLVIEDRQFPGNEHLVAVDQVTHIDEFGIHLKASKAEVKAMRPFVRGDHRPGEVRFGDYDAGEYSLWVGTQPKGSLLSLEHDHAPQGLAALQEGASVMASDGTVGRVDDFIVDPATEKITHVVLKEGHLWALRVISVPVSAIASMSRDRIVLNLTKAQIGALPDMFTEMHPPAARPAGSAPAKGTKYGMDDRE